MTLVVAVKVNAGIVFAADSAISVQDALGNTVNVYNNGNKVFNLYKGLPIGLGFAGTASIGSFSISILAKDFRASALDVSSAYYIDPVSYAISDVASKFADFIFKNHYDAAFPVGGIRPILSFFIGGYSTGASLGEVYSLQSSDTGFIGPTLGAAQDATGVLFNGQPEAVFRLIFGFGSGLGAVLENDLGVAPTEIQNYMQTIQQKLTNPFAYAGMPLQDVIEFAEFLIDLTIKYTRFLPGAQSVGGPIEIASMTKHEGFKWITRKHYYNQEINRLN